MEKYLKRSQCQTLLAFLVIIHFGTQALCPNGCKCNDNDANHHANCFNADLDIIPITLHPYITRLNLRKNRIRSIDDIGLSFYHRLTYIDLSENHLLKISPGSFARQTKLLELNLNSNQISQISNLTFGTEEESESDPIPKPGLKFLSILNLRDNFLEEFDPGIFGHLQGLKELDLGQNRIKVLNTRFFEDLNNLNVLKLDNNQFAQVPPVFSKNSISSGAFMNGSSNSSSKSIYLSHLFKLFLGFNINITTLRNNGFGAGKNLVTLDLQSCGISTIEPLAFEGLDLLRKLVLSNNHLSIVPTNAFSPLAQLKTLEIGRNPIKQFEGNAFRGLNVLKNLNVSGASELQLVDKDAFGSNFDLDTIELSNGKKMTALPSRLFRQQSLKYLDLKDNSLTIIPADLLDWRSLHLLKLDGNPFRCDCKLLWLKVLLLQDEFKNSSSISVICKEPKEFKGKRLIEVSNSDLKCYRNQNANVPAQKTVLGISVALSLIVLIIFFFIMYKYQDRIKNTLSCKQQEPASIVILATIPVTEL